MLKYLQTLHPVHTLSLLFLSYKLVTLLLLLTGQRIQTIHCIDVDYMKINENRIFIEIRELLKCSKPGVHLEPIDLPAYSEDNSLCIVHVLTEYINRTE